MIGRGRGAVVAALVALAAFAGAVPAALADHTQRLDVAALLVRQQAGGKPWIIDLSLGAALGSTDDGTVPAPIRDMRFSFTKGARVHPEAFSTCSARVLQDKGPNGCPSTSRLGKGTAVAAALGATYPATIAVFNGPATPTGRRVFIYARALGTVVIPLTGTLRKTSGRFGWVLDVPVQRIQIAGDQYVSITSFAVTVGGIGRHGVPFIEAPTSCHAPGWPFLGRFTYDDGTVGTSAATISCLLKATNSP